MRYAIPAAVLAILLVLFAIGLRLDPREVPSPLIGKPAPGFDVPTLDGAPGRYSVADLKGRPVLVNFWASWCTPCLQEHPLLMELARDGIPIVGFNYKDEPEHAQRWLRRHANPYTLVAVDADGRVGLDWGVYGVPETYLLDAQGVIRYKQIGPLTREVWEREMSPLFGGTS